MTADSRSTAKSPATATAGSPASSSEGRAGSREPPGTCGEEREPRRVDERPADNLGGGDNVRFPREPARGVPGQVIRDRKRDDRDQREREQDNAR